MAWIMRLPGAMRVKRYRPRRSARGIAPGQRPGVSPLQAAQKFYGEVPGIATSERNGLMTLHRGQWGQPLTPG